MQNISKIIEDLNFLKSKLYNGIYSDRLQCIDEAISLLIANEDRDSLSFYDLLHLVDMCSAEFDCDKCYELSNVVCSNNCTKNFAVYVKDRIHSSMNDIYHSSSDTSDNWILCTDGMPPERKSMFYKYRGTSHWRPSMFETISDTVNVTIVDDKGDKCTTYAHTVEGEWKCDLLRSDKSLKVYAWKPFPKPCEIHD